MASRRISVVVDLNSPVPAYRQIVEGLRVHLVQGDLRPGDRLPSVRELASDLGLHFNTVAEAYRQLAAEGWLRLDRGRGGVHVVERQAAEQSPGDAGGLARRIRVLVAEARASGVAVRTILDELSAAQTELESTSPLQY
jgi:GntR family transcriptional regulator